MIETAQRPATEAPLDPRQLVLPSLIAMVQDLTRLLPPSNMVQALQAKQLLQQMTVAVQVIKLPSLRTVLQSMQPVLWSLMEGHTEPHPKAAELLHLAAHDVLAHLQALQAQQEAPPLFPSYRALVRLAGKDTAHPADLWDTPWPTPQLPAPADTEPLPPSAQLRLQLDQQVLRLMQVSTPDHATCQQLRHLSLGLAAYAPQSGVWQLAAAWLEGLQAGWLPHDVYAKRMASRLLSQYAALARGETQAPTVLLRDLLYFCAQAMAAAQTAQQALPAALAMVGAAHANLTTAVSTEQANPPTTNDSTATPEPKPATVEPHASTSEALTNAEEAAATAAFWAEPTPSAADTQPQVPSLAPALPAFAQAANIQPQQQLLEGLAGNQGQVEPDHDFLHTAETLTQALETALQHWHTGNHPAHAEQAATDAQQLSRMAWTSGCADIATLSHLLQRCLRRMDANTRPEQLRICHHASEEISRLLHQFAAGFMRRAHPQVMEALNQLYSQLPDLPAPTASTPAETADAAETSLSADAGEHASTAATEALAANDAGAGTGAPADTAAATLAASATPAQAEPDAPAQDTDAVPHTATPTLVLPSHAPAPMDPMHFEVFAQEMQSAWPRMQAGLRQWMQQPDHAVARQTLLRGLHTLKGSARLAGAMAWASQVHALETLALQVPNTDDANGPASLRAPLEALRVAFAALQQEMAERHPPQDTAQQQPLHTVARHAQALWGAQDAGDMALQASQLSLQEIARGLQRLRAQIQDCAAWADTLMLHGEFDMPYEWHEELQDLVHQLNDCTDDLGTAHQQMQHGLADVHSAMQSHSGHLRALQHTLLYARLAPLASLQPRLQATLELAQQDIGKQAQLHWQGLDVLMEREQLQTLAPALEHLLRNCLAHGIEPEQERIAAGKPVQGTVAIRLHTQGTEHILSIEDDGAGLNLPAIAERARALGLLAADAVLDVPAAAALITQPGLSTSAQVSELAGRGIGMDAVVDILRNLGAQWELSSEPGQGCRFDIRLPAAPQIDQVLALRAGSWRVALPAKAIEAVRRLPIAAADAALQQGVLQDPTWGPMPVYWAGSVWQQSTHSVEHPLDGLRPILVVRGSTSRWAMVVDEVLGTQEVALQTPPALAVPVPGLLGTATQPNGRVLQVYAADVALQTHENRLLSQPRLAVIEAAAPAAPQRPLVLLADDSLSVRRLAQHLLQSNGLQVITAADGLEALQLLEGETLPALVVADIEMPDMDGVELLRRMRADPRCKHLPVIMLTAHAAGPVSQQVIDLGAQAFLTKPYAPHELLAHVWRYCSIDREAAA